MFQEGGRGHLSKTTDEPGEMRLEKRTLGLALSLQQQWLQRTEGTKA